MARCKAQRCVSILVRFSNVRASLDEQLSDDEMAVGGCNVEGSTKALFAWIRIYFVVIKLLHERQDENDDSPLDVVQSRFP
jgi:hypothetical protein